MLKNFEIFKGLSDKELADVEGICRVATYARGTTIFNQGDSFDDFFIIESGQVEISVKDAFHAKKVLTVLRNHDFFGEMGLFDRSSIRSASAKALQTTRLIMIPGIAFEELLRDKPSISMKLLSTISRRLKESNLKMALAQAGERTKEGKIITLASARNGYGKTTFATSLAQLISRELGKSVLYVDLDLHFGDGTYYMGISTSKTLQDFTTLMKTTPDPSKEEVMKLLFRHHDTLCTLAAPGSFLEAEECDPGTFVAASKILRHHFDYLILDTDSSVSDMFLNGLDISDIVVFLADVNTPLSAKNNARYFQTLARLNFPPERMNILAAKTGEEFNVEKVSAAFKNEFKYKILGGIPLVKNQVPDFGKTFYQLSPEGHYCGLLRHFVKAVLKEEIQQSAKTEGTFLNRLFGKNERGQNLWSGKLDTTEVATEVLRPGISEKNLNSMFRSLRKKMIEGYFGTVRSEIQNALELCPNSAIAYQFLGETFMAEKDFSSAISAFQQAHELDPENGLSLGFFAHLTGNEGLFAKALDLLKTQSEAKPDYADLQNDMGRLLFLRGDHQKALTFFQKALKINPRFTEARINVGVTHGELGAYDQAIRELASVNPQNLRVNYILGRFYFNLERFAEAQEHFEKAASLRADYLDLENRLEALRGYFKQINLLLEKYQDLIKNHPEFPDLHLYLGELYYKAGKYKEAVEEAKEALRLKPNYREAKEKLEEFKKRG